jgi:hypothetical protein
VMTTSKRPYGVRRFIAVCCSAISLQTPISRTNPRAAGAVSAPFLDQALALKAAASTHALSPARQAIVRLMETISPLERSSEPKAHRGEASAPLAASSISHAIEEADRLMQVPEPRPGVRLWNEIHDDLEAAASTHDSRPLLRKWNARYPGAPYRRKLSAQELTRLIELAQQIFVRSLEAPPSPDDPQRWAREDAEDEPFLRKLRASIDSDLENAAARAGYDSPVDMVQDAMDTAGLETTFTIHVPRALEQRLGERSPLALVVRGTPRGTRVALALKRRFPILRSLEWWLRINGDVVNDLFVVILHPTDRLEIVVPPHEDAGGNAAHPPRFGFGRSLLRKKLCSIAEWLGSRLHAEITRRAFRQHRQEARMKYQWPA